jgi:hypothetical protein
MEQQELKRIVAGLLAEGLPLSRIQEVLKERHQTSITFLELRLLASELENVDWSLHNKPETKEKASGATPPRANAVQDPDEEEFDDDTAGYPDAPPTGGGATVVELSKLVRPGALACGKVTFGSGAKAEWVLDQFGRLGLEKAVGKPTPQDLQEFQIELQKSLSRSGF